MTAQPLGLTDRCPTWCQDHYPDEDAEWTEHVALVGVAGSLEVSLECLVLPGQPDPVSELVVYASGERASGNRLFATALDASTINGLAGLLTRALAVAQG